MVVPGTPGPGRGIFRASNGVGYTVAGTTVYRVESNNTLTKIGSLAFNSGFMTSMRDNGLAALLVDNSAFGYTWDITTGGNFSQIKDSTNTFTGGTKADFVDGYLVWNFPGTNQWGCTNLNALTFNGTLVGDKDGYPDPIASLIVNRREILLFGSGRGSEIWYNAGNPLFPFAILPGAYIEWGCAAPYSVAAVDIDVFWLAQGEAGAGLVLRQRGYVTQVVSTFPISYAMQQMPTITDAIGFAYTRDGHSFYGLHFPSGDQSWFFDTSVQDPHLAWHQRAFSDADGVVLHRDRVISAAYVNGRNIGQDWQNGTLYTIDPDYYYDDVDDGDGQGVFNRPIVHVRTFPLLRAGTAGGGLTDLDGMGARVNKFLAGFQCGDGSLGPNNVPPSLALRVSFDRGRTFGNNILQSTAEFSERGDVIEASYRILPQWQNLGVGRWPIFELSWSFAGPAALAGAWVNVEKLVV